MSKLIDLTNQNFYEWTVIRKDKATKDGKTRWLCQCSCGKIRVVGGYDLKNGRHKSCGHDRKTTLIDIKGQVFGELTVIEYIGDSKWKCECICGKLIEVRSYDLTTGHTKSCGHNTTGFKDIKGQTFGEWTVLEYVGNHFWKCECSCGTISSIHSYSLRSGGSKSCGHNTTSKQLEDLTGQEFNEWTVLKYIGDSAWECKCSCGTVSKVAAYDLKQGNSRNCGHNRHKPYNDLTEMKFGELKVLKYLCKNIYLCECSCGTQKEIMGSNLLNGSTVSCGCKHATIYTEDFLRAFILNYTNKHGEKPFTRDIANELGVTFYYINSLLNKHDLKYLMNDNFNSSYERDIYKLIKEINPDIDIKIKNRTILGNGKELDIYIPNKKLAIEFNGDYWHNVDRLGSTYHQQKTINCARKGVQLIHIFEHEWMDLNTRKKIIEIIKNKIDTPQIERVYARKCKINRVTIQEERNFLNNHHLQNYTTSQVAYGLYLNNELISIMTFGRPRFNTTVQWELIRYCTGNNKAIIGGAEKLFAHFIREYDPTSIVSYCDISKFTGNKYLKMGFKTTVNDVTLPNYKWLKPGVSGTDVLTRYQTQKQRLLELGYGEYGNTEDEIMKNMGYVKVYDSGNMRFMWNRD